MVKPGDHYFVENGGDVRLNGELVGRVDDGSFFVWNGHGLRRPSLAGQVKDAPEGPAYEAWNDYAAAQGDVEAQMHELMKQGLMPRALALNAATRRLLGDLTAKAGQLGYSEIRSLMIDGGPRKFMGLGIQDDETALKPEVRPYGRRSPGSQ